MILIYVGIFSTALVVTSYIFLNLNNFRLKIENVIYKHTGYVLDISNIKTSISSSLHPVIIINDLIIKNPIDYEQKLKINQISFVFSYKSILSLEPIFQSINISNTDIILKYLKNGNLLFNGINLNFPDQKILNNTKHSSIDIENWLLKQQNITLSNFNIKYINYKHESKPLILNYVNLFLNSSDNLHHNLLLTINNENNNVKQLLSVNLNWNGGKFSEIKNWQLGNMNIKIPYQNSPMQYNLIKYISLPKILDKINSDTLISAEIQNGRLNYFYADFDLKNLVYIIKNSKNFINFPIFGGKLRIYQLNNNKYNIIAHNFNIKYNDKYLLKNKEIIGNYELDKHGYFKVENLDLAAFNDLLNILPINTYFNIKGDIKSLQLDWSGNILNVNNYQLKANFQNFAISSDNKNIPYLDNVSGKIIVTKTTGSLDILMKKSTLLYPKIFLIPYKFDSLTSNLTWKINEDKTITVLLNNTNLVTPDFQAVVSGNYNYIPKSKGYLKLNAKLNKISINKVGDYLPKVIGDHVHKWLNNSLISGYGVNGKLIFDGPLEHFPYLNNQGKFYIDANIINAHLLYAKGWPPITNIEGQFSIRNQQILITTHDATISNNKITSATVVIPNMVDHINAHLTAQGEAFGKTNNFLLYLENSPINKKTGELYKKLDAVGNGNVKINLYIPFKNVIKSKVRGKFIFDNNKLRIKFHVPELEKVNGDVVFRENGYNIHNLTVEALSSKFIVNTNDNKGSYKYNIFSQNVNTKKALLFYFPLLSKSIEGITSANINFTIDKTGLNNLNINSDLTGVTIKLPAVLQKSMAEKKHIYINLMLNKFTANKLFINYNNIVNTSIFFNAENKTINSIVYLGPNTNKEVSSNNAKVLFKINLVKIVGEQWFSDISRIFTKNNESISTDSTTNIQRPSSYNVFPIEILLDVKNLYFLDTNYYHTNTDILIKKNNIIFSFNNMYTNGYGVYIFNKNLLNIYMNSFNAYKTVEKTKSLIKKNESIASDNLKIKNDFYFINSLEAITNSSITHFIPEKYLTQIADILKKNNSNININSKLPTMNFLINDLYFENIRIAKLNFTIKKKNEDLLVTPANLTSKYFSAIFNLKSFCYYCDINRAFVNLNIKFNIQDLGNLLDSIGIKKFAAGGNGSIVSQLQWNGRIKDFKLSNLIGKIDIVINNGKFLKVKTGGILADIIGIINLQTITNLWHLDFSNAFANGFYFNKLYIESYLLNNMLTIKSLYMSGPLADVYMFGSINIHTEEIDSYLKVVPKVGAGFAIGAATATLNPLVGVIVYIGELLLGEPINKILSFSYHITGKLKKPSLIKMTIPKQLANNINSIFRSPPSTKLDL